MWHRSLQVRAFLSFLSKLTFFNNAIERVDLILLSRPFSQISSIIQAGGRGGRIMRDGGRRKVVVYLLYNNTDLRANAGHISVDVRNLYKAQSCTKQLLYDFYSVRGEVMTKDSNWCCEHHY